MFNSLIQFCEIYISIPRFPEGSTPVVDVISNSQTMLSHGSTTATPPNKIPPNPPPLTLLTPVPGSDSVASRSVFIPERPPACFQPESTLQSILDKEATKETALVHDFNVEGADTEAIFTFNDDKDDEENVDKGNSFQDLLNALQYSTKLSKPLPMWKQPAMLREIVGRVD